MDDNDVEPKRQKGGIYDEEGDFEVDAADYSVGDYGRTDGTGRNLVHGDVERDLSTTLEMTKGALEMTKGALGMTKRMLGRY